MTELQDEREFRSLTEKISRERGFACSSYKDRCLRRRIAVRMRARGAGSYGDYAAILDRDTAEYELLLQALTINVTKLFRNPEVYESIARNVVPTLWAAPDRSLRIWSAGCASGEEPYSLAILMHRHAQQTGSLSRLAGVRVLGTDIDEPSLQTAREGKYLEPAFADMTPALRETYFSPGWPAQVRPDIASMVEFRHSDLFASEKLLSPFHLIVCRNVIIYFDRESQERLFCRFHSLLAPGGFLVLGKVETILGEARSLFAAVDARERIFRKL